MEPEVNPARVIRKVMWTLLPWLWVAAFWTYMDRSNLTFAAFQIRALFNLSNTTYGLAGTLFFVGYCAAQLPTNVGMRLLPPGNNPNFLGAIVVIWGTIAACTAAQNTVAQFLALRVLLGIAEAGIFGCSWIHMSQFLSATELTFAMGVFFSVTAISQVIGAPLAAAFLVMDGIHGLRGWQWLYIITGILTVAYGVALKFGLAKLPSTIWSLTVKERAWLVKRQEAEEAARNIADPDNGTILGCLANWRIWWLSCAWLLEETVRYGIVFWTPLLLDAMLNGGFNGKAPKKIVRTVHQQATYSAKLACISAILYVFAALGTILVSWSSKRFQDRRFHISIPLLISGIAFMCVGDAIKHQGAVVGFVVLVIAGASDWSCFGPAFSWPAELFHGRARAVAVGLFNTLGTCGGIIGPYLVGRVSDDTGSYKNAMIVLGAFQLASAVLFFTFPEPKRSAPGTPQTSPGDAADPKVTYNPVYKAPAEV
ncbi:hypothetical protein WJX72_003060 [[Myrmecia] bisecta]|uniref:Major facilitator superfamily (MFS) profile domain-containing protein n=1 Tax=[Myrmecia] bisecta TaxID=41462 RepID=A0AAW1PLD5_9CHLO